jgi:hypothetical protein
MDANIVQIMIYSNIRNGIIAFLAPENVCSGTKIERLSGLKAEILKCKGFYMAAIMKFQGGRHNVS